MAIIPKLLADSGIEGIPESSLGEEPSSVRMESEREPSCRRIESEKDRGDDKSNQDDYEHRFRALEKAHLKLQRHVHELEMRFSSFSTWASESILRFSNPEGESTPSVKSCGESLRSGVVGGDEKPVQVKETEDLRVLLAGESPKAVEGGHRKSNSEIGEHTRCVNKSEEEETSNPGSKILESKVIDEVGLDNISSGYSKDEKPCSSKNLIAECSKSSDQSESFKSKALAVVQNSLMWTDLKSESNISSLHLRTPSRSSSSSSCSLRIACDEATNQGDAQRSPSAEGSSGNEFRIMKRVRRKSTYSMNCDYCGKEYKQLGSLSKHLRYCGSHAWAMYNRYRLQSSFAVGAAAPPSLSSNPYASLLANSVESLIHTGVSRRVLTANFLQQQHSGKETGLQQQGGSAEYKYDTKCEFHCRVCGLTFPSLSYCRQHVINAHYEDVLHSNSDSLPEAMDVEAIPRAGSTEAASGLNANNLTLIRSGAMASSTFTPFSCQRSRSPTMDQSSNPPSFVNSFVIMERNSETCSVATAAMEHKTYTTEAEANPSCSSGSGYQRVLTQEGPYSIGGPGKSVYFCVYCKAGNRYGAEFTSIAGLQAHIARYHSGHSFSSVASMGGPSLDF